MKQPTRQMLQNQLNEAIAWSEANRLSRRTAQHILDAICEAQRTGNVDELDAARFMLEGFLG